MSSSPTSPDLMAEAITWVLRRMTQDPRLAYLIGPGSESFERLVTAGAAIAREEVDPFRENFLGKLQTQPVAAIGAAGAVIDAELLARIAAYDENVHDLGDQSDLDMLINHFVRRGLEVAEADRDHETGRLF